MRSSPSLNITTRTTAQDIDKVSAEDLESMTIYYQPPEVYPSASILVDHTFPEKGMFAGVVTVSMDEQEWVSVFPFSVGEGQPIAWFSTVLPAVLIVGAAAIFFIRSRKKPEAAA